MPIPPKGSIPPANRRTGNLARVARRGKPIRQTATSTSFKPEVILPDPRIRAAREAFYKALQKRAEELERLVIEAVNEKEADHWRGLLDNLRGG
jgi:hypothetical protein